MFLFFYAIGLYQYNKTFFFGQQLFLRQFSNPRVDLRGFSLLSFPFHYLNLLGGEAGVYIARAFSVVNISVV